MTAFLSLGDRSTTFLLGREIATLKAEIERRTRELGTGQTTDLSRRARGDFQAIAMIENRLTLTEARHGAIAEAQSFGAAQQTALGVVEERAQAASAVLIGVPEAPTAPTLDRAGETIRQAFETALGALNTKSAGRALFAGAATDNRALAPADAILAELETLVAAETTAAGVAAQVAAWFDTPGGGFETSGYTGSAAALAPFELGEGETADFALTALDPDLREALKGFALGALLSGSTLSGNTSERLALARTAAIQALNASGKVVHLRASIGVSEEAAASAMTRIATERSALEIERGAIRGIDPYDSATRLETAQTQLETLYTLTARISRLKLTDFLG